MADRGTAGAKPPASPSVTMQYETCSPSSVKVAIVPAAPKSTSSGCATTTSTRSTTYSSAICLPLTSTGPAILRDGAAGRVPVSLDGGASTPPPRHVSTLVAAAVTGHGGQVRPHPLGAAVYAVPVHRAIVAALAAAGAVAFASAALATAGS